MPKLAFILIRSLIYLAQVYTSLIVITALLSWFVSPMSRLMQFLRSLTSPVVEPFRALTQRFIPTNVPIDISPLLAYFALELIISLLSRLLYQLPVY